MSATGAGEFKRQLSSAGSQVSGSSAGAGGLQIESEFCPEHVQDPFDMVAWELRSAAIKDESGAVMFEQHDCEIPSTWSQLATNVVVSKYFYGENGTAERERSVRQLIHRVTRTIADWGVEDGYFATAEDGERFYRELTWLCLHQYGAFNSPVWFNVGLHHQYGVQGARCNWHWDSQAQAARQPENPYEFPQASACFIQSVADNMEDIMRLATSEAMLFKFGSGTGTDLSTIRSHREKLSGGGKPSGPLSFMRVYDQIAAVVKSGGKTRRAAKMQSLKVWHPDILEFIECKWKEEKKAHVLIEKGGYEANFNGEAYSSILFQNANLSVRVTDDFMEAVEKGGQWRTRWVTPLDGAQEPPTYDARWLLRRMAECAWRCGDPGVQYDTTINKWHTCPNSGRINASNPCSEYMFLDDTACFAPETRISTPHGLRTVEDLFFRQESGEEIVITTELHSESDHRRMLAHRPALVTKVGERSVFRMTLQDGRSIRVTGDHRFLTSEGNWERVDELQPGADRIQVRLTGNPVSFTSSDAEVRRWRTLGWLTGDGVFSKGAVALVFGPEETTTAEFMEAEFNRLIDDGIQWSDAPARVRTCSIGEQKNGVLQITSSGRPLATYLEEHYGFKQATAIAKDVPTSIHQQPEDLKVAYLQGLFSADGFIRQPGVGTEKEVMLASSSPELLRSVQLLLNDLGMVSRITWMHPTGRKNPQGQLHLYNQQARKFLMLIGFPCSARKDAEARAIVESPFRGALKNPRPAAIVSIEADGVETVYDITEPTTHSVIAEGMIAHNCNLSSVNLMKFRQPDGEFDVERFKAACRIFFIAQEILVDHASYPTDRIAENSHRFRPLGLGYSNLGSLIMTSGSPYDSDAALGLCGSVTALLHGAANLTSVEMAKVMGPFAGYAANREPFLKVMQLHRKAVEEINDAGPQTLKDAARRLWDQVVAEGKKHGFRNAQATVLAPTGTISFLLDCDTTGIEPDIALVKYKQLAGGGMLKIVNNTVPLALRALGYDERRIQAIAKHIDKHDTIEGAPDLATEHLPVFDCAFKPAGGARSIAWRAHVRMLAAAQPFISGAISKSVNMPSDVTPEDIADAYHWGWKLGLKALAIYRDGSKQSQPLSTKSEGDRAAEKAVALPRRERLPDTRQSITHKFNVGGHEGYINVGLYPDGRPGELFITMAKEGSTIGGLMDSFGTAISLSLQYGVPLEVLVNKFSHTRFEPMGHTTNPDIRIAKSVVDYIFRWLGVAFLPGYREANGGLPAKTSGREGEEPSGKQAPAKAGQKAGGAKAHGTISSVDFQAAADPVGNGQIPARDGLEVDQNGGPLEGPLDQFARFQSDAPSCDNCGAITVRNGNCYLCYNCGNSMGCS